MTKVSKPIFFFTIENQSNQKQHSSAHKISDTHKKRDQHHWIVENEGSDRVELVHINYVYMSSDGPQKGDSPFWRHVPFGLHVWKSLKCGRRVAKRVLCRLVNKGLYGIGQHVYWCADFTNLAIAVYASHEIGAVYYGSCCTL